MNVDDEGQWWMFMRHFRQPQSTQAAVHDGDGICENGVGISCRRGARKEQGWETEKDKSEWDDVDYKIFFYYKIGHIRVVEECLST